MRDNNKTKKQLVQELTALRSQNADLKKSTAGNLSTASASEESARYAESILGTVREPLLVLDADLKIVSANHNFYKTFKVTPDETIGSFIYDLGNKQWDISKLRELLEEILPEKETFNGFEVTHNFQDIGHKIMLLNARQIEQGMGKERIILLAIEDITARKKAENDLHLSDEKFRSYVEQASEAIYLFQLKEPISVDMPVEEQIKNLYEGYVIEANDSLAKMYGFDKANELNGMTLAEFHGSTDNPKNLEFLRAWIEANYRITDTESKEVDNDGNELWITNNLIGHVEDGYLIHIWGTQTNITERKQAEEKLEEANTIINKSPSVAFTWENEEGWPAKYVSKNVGSLLGYTVKDFTSGNVAYLKCIHPDDIERVIQEVMEVSSDKSKEEFVHEPYRVVTKDGKVKFVSDWTFIVRDEKGNVTHYKGIIADITKRKQAEENLQDTLESLRKAVATTIQVMVSTVEARDPYTAGHQLRVADLARTIATEMGLPQEKIEGIRMAGSIHDIGKLSIPAEILSKPGKLSDIEFSLIKEHARKGYEMLKDVDSPWPLAEIVYQHHERMDGSGYPRNLKGDEILMDARIMAVADVVEGMASHRPYRATLGIDAALKEIEDQRGVLYDADVVDTCLRLFRKKDYQLQS